MVINLKNVLIFLTTFIYYCRADEFKRCPQQAFCTRNLYFEDRPESYHVERSTVAIEKNKISFVLRTSIENENLKDISMSLYILKNGIFRVKIRDLENQRFHFKKNDETFQMKTMAKKKNFKFVNSTETKFSVYYFDKVRKSQFFIDIDTTKKTKYELVVQYNPFAMFYSIDNKEVIRINSKNLLNIEFPTEKYIKSEEEAMSSVKLDMTFNDCQLLWGLAERGADTLLSDTKAEDAYRMFNIDNFKYAKDQTLGLYGSWPLIIAYGVVYSGFMWNNPSETYVGIQSQEGNKNVLWISEKGVIDFSFWGDANIHNFYFKYHRYIGFASLPPIFALGYHQSRWNYKDTQDAFNVDRLFDENDIPYDSLWLDIDHTEQKKYMTWNSNFEGIEDFIENLDNKSRNLVVIIDPHIKVDRSYFVYREASTHNYFIRDPVDPSTPNILNEKPFAGKCWCDEASYLDFYNIKVRKFWSELIKSADHFFFEATNVHVWNDMNEPSVFNQADVTLPRMASFQYYNKVFEHRDAHNAYGYLMHRTSYEALKDKYNKRPFVLTRSFWIGSHRFGAVWTGDTRSRFEDMELSIAMVISNSIVGFSFNGADVGGFFGDVDHYLLTRWYLLGVFYPFFRAHSHNETYRREPWLYDASTREIIKTAIITRYKLLPYIYFTFFQYHKSGLPMIRPMWFRYHNKYTLDLYSHTQFFFGDALLIRPVLTEHEHWSNLLSTYLPEDDRWYNFYTFKEFLTKGEVQVKISDDQIGVFIKGGSIIPMKWRIRRSAELMKFEPITLIVALNSDDSASGMVYFDDEVSFDYEQTGKYYLKRIMFQRDELFIANLHDEFKISNKIERILILGLTKKIANVYFENFLDGKKLDLEFEVREDSVLEIKRLQISFDYLWKVKINYKEDNE